MSVMGKMEEKEEEKIGLNSQPEAVAPSPVMGGGRQSSIVLGVLLLLIFAFIWIETGTYSEDLLDVRKITGPGTFPRLLSGIAALIGVREIARGYAAKRAAAKSGQEKRCADWVEISADLGNRNIFMVILMTVLFIPLTRWLGFSAGSGVYALVLMARLKAKTWQAVLSSALAIMFVVVVFSYVFRVQLPVGILTEPLGWRY